MIIWEKHEPSDKIWWKYNSEVIGEFVFSFDKEKEFYLYRDYDKLSKKQKKIFDAENPEWAEFFAGKR